MAVRFVEKVGAKYGLQTIISEPAITELVRQTQWTAREVGIEGVAGQVYLLLCEEMEEMQREGCRIVQVCIAGGRLAVLPASLQALG